MESPFYDTEIITKSIYNDSLAPVCTGLSRLPGGDLCPGPLQRDMDKVVWKRGEGWKGRPPGHTGPGEGQKEKNKKKAQGILVIVFKNEKDLEKNIFGFCCSSGQNMNQLIQINIKKYFLTTTDVH